MIGTIRFASRRRGRSPVALTTAALIMALILAVVASVAIGAVTIAPPQALAILADVCGLHLGVPYDARQEHVLLAIRLPRVLLGVMIGMGLGMSGGAMQGIFRNPLADPGLIGTSSGAALGASAAIVIGGPVAVFGAFAAELLVPAAAFAGALLASLVVYRYARGGAPARAEMLILAGVSVNALAGAGTGLLSYLSSDAQLRSIAFWSMGALGGATWHNVAIAAPLIGVALLLLPRAAGRLDALLLGDAEAAHLGVDVPALRRRVIVAVALAVGASVAIAGAIGFVGLVAPHIVRMVVGPSHRTLLVCSALLGASMLLVSDLLARTIVSPAEVPIGIITAFIGAPFFAWLVARGMRLEAAT